MQLWLKTDFIFIISKYTHNIIIELGSEVTKKCDKTFQTVFAIIHFSVGATGSWRLSLLHFELENNIDWTRCSVAVQVASCTWQEMLCYNCCNCYNTDTTPNNLTRHLILLMLRCLASTNAIFVHWGKVSSRLCTIIFLNWWIHQ